MGRPFKYDAEMKQTTLRMPKGLLASLDAAAKKQNRTRAEIMVEALIQRYPPRQPAKRVNVFE